MAFDGEYLPSPMEWVRDQVDEYESSGGTCGNTLRDTGFPVMIVTHRGVKTGAVRKTPLMRVERDGVYAAVAGCAGSPEHPLWYFNLLADPHVEVQDGADRWQATARELSGDERTLWWDRAVATFPPYADFQQRTSRVIPVFVLEKTG